MKTILRVLVFVLVATGLAVPQSVEAGHWKWVTTPVRVPVRAIGRAASRPFRGGKVIKCSVASADGTMTVAPKKAVKRAGLLDACNMAGRPFTPLSGRIKKAVEAEIGEQFKTDKKGKGRVL